MLKINTLRAAIEKANTWCRANPEAWTVFVEEGGIETTGETPSSCIAILWCCSS